MLHKMETEVEARWIRQGPSPPGPCRSYPEGHL